MEFVLILKIGAGKKPQYYRLREHKPHPHVARRAWRLELPSGKFYDVHQDRYGVHCSCPDSTFRRQHSAVPCKHGQALLAFNLLEKPT